MNRKTLIFSGLMSKTVSRPLTVSALLLPTSLSRLSHGMGHSPLSGRDNGDGRFHTLVWGISGAGKTPWMQELVKKMVDTRGEVDYAFCPSRSGKRHEA
ncbi:hypothetical protein NKZ99_004245 [Salmonella enterica]|nr:hypothetical protein [Salmonella enterica]